MARKTDIEMARMALAKVTRAEVRLQASLEADYKLNNLLADRLEDFDKQLQSGSIPTLTLQIVSGTKDE